MDDAKELGQVLNGCQERRSRVHILVEQCLECWSGFVDQSLLLQSLQCQMDTWSVGQKNFLSHPPNLRCKAQTLTCKHLHFEFPNPWWFLRLRSSGSVFFSSVFGFYLNFWWLESTPKGSSCFIVMNVVKTLQLFLVASLKPFRRMKPTLALFHPRKNVHYSNCEKKVNIEGGWKGVRRLLWLAWTGKIFSHHSFFHILFPHL